ncbi:MAG: hypothetical protein FIA99_08510 [Ruminiclostridium sp.]|nr:hypothetical protein [Ruminiclostridium sp.]
MAADTMKNCEIARHRLPAITWPGSKEVNMLETDLYKPVYDYLVHQGYSVHSEVKNCDITAIKGEELIVVELKTSFNLKLLAQGAKRQRIADSVYVAIPAPKGGKRSAGWRDMYLLLRRLELGLILVTPGEENPGVEIAFHPNTFDRLKSANSGKKHRNHIIREVEARYANYNVGGSSKRKLMTAYRENSVFVACCFLKYGPLSPAQLKKLGTGVKTPSILSKNFYGWFEKISKGIYSLNPQAEEFLQGYPELVSHYMEKLDQQPADIF